MKFFAILAAKITILIGQIFKRGSVYPGMIALKIDKKIMQKLKFPEIRVAVTGSSGKGSTTSLIASSLKSEGLKVTHNASGSNLVRGVLTAILKDTSLNGKVKTDALVLECDERYTKYIFAAVKPKIVVITNITRDQPPRQGDFDLVFAEIKKALTKDMKLILNADDPYLEKFALEFKNIMYYSIAENELVTKTSLFEALNLVYCPRCNKKLDYAYYHFENLGSYACPSCGLQKPKAKYIVNKIDYEKNEILINNQSIKLKIPLLYNVYNVLAVYSVLAELGLKEKNVANLINKNSKENKKQYCHLKQKRDIYILNNKNENSTTFNQSLLFLNRHHDIKTVVIGWKEISRRYNYNDLSWLYDINFEILNQHQLETVVTVGKERYDIAVRLKIAGINEEKIKCFETLEEACAYIKENTQENIYAILNFDYVEPFTALMEDEKNV